jgi:hypothetical protein
MYLLILLNQGVYLLLNRLSSSFNLMPALWTFFLFCLNNVFDGTVITKSMLNNKNKYRTWKNHWRDILKAYTALILWILRCLIRSLYGSFYLRCLWYLFFSNLFLTVNLIRRFYIDHIIMNGKNIFIGQQNILFDFMLWLFVFLWLFLS